MREEKETGIELNGGGRVGYWTCGRVVIHCDSDVDTLTLSYTLLFG
jgi:hypothetical protein